MIALAVLTTLIWAADDDLPVPPPKPPTRETLTLQTALQDTDDHLPAIHAAEANTDAAHARMTEQRGPLLPQLSGQAGLVATQFFGSENSGTLPSRGSGSGAGTGSGSSNGGTSGASGGSTSTATISGNGVHAALSLTATQLLWDFGNTLDRYRSFKAAIAQYHYTEEETRVVAHQTTRSAYYNGRALRALADVARETLDNEKKHLEQTEGMVQVGTQPEIALATEKTTYANDVFQIFQSEGNYLSGKALLNQAMGIEGPTDYDVEAIDAPPVPGEDKSIEDLMPEALQVRPAYLSIEAQVEAQRLLVGSYKGAIWPSLGVLGSLSAIDGLSSGSTGWGGELFGEAYLSWTLFNGLTNFGNIHEQEADLASLEAQRDQLRQQIRVDVEQARVGVATAKSGLTSAKAAVVNAHEQLRLAEERYKTGVGSIIELGDAQVAYTTAEVQLISAQYTLNNARATLMAKLGRS